MSAGGEVAIVEGRADLAGSGHDKPTFLLTNDWPKRYPARQVMMDYANGNPVERNLAEKITFFYPDCLAGEVRLNMDFDLILTVCTHLLYQCLAPRHRSRRCRWRR